MKTKFDPTATIRRDFVIKCRANRGGKYLVPIESWETVPSSDPLMDYDIVESSKYLGSVRTHLEKRGDLVKIKDGSDRITRTPHIGKAIRKGRNGKVFVHVASVPVPEYVLFTKRTEDPKLTWLIRRCESQGLRIVRHGQSWHAPITYIHRDDYAKAWKILGPVDDVRDDHPRFETATA